MGDIYYENLEIYSNVLRPKEIRPHKRNYSTTQLYIMPTDTESVPTSFRNSYVDIVSNLITLTFSIVLPLWRSGSIGSERHESTYYKFFLLSHAMFGTLLVGLSSITTFKKQLQNNQYLNKLIGICGIIFSLGGFGIVGVLPGQRRVMIPLYSSMLIYALKISLNILLNKGKNNHATLLKLLSVAGYVRFFIGLFSILSIFPYADYDVATMLSGIIVGNQIFGIFAPQFITIIIIIYNIILFAISNLLNKNLKVNQFGYNDRNLESLYKLDVANKLNPIAIGTNLLHYKIQGINPWN